MPKNTEELSNAIIDLLKNNEKASKLGISARERVIRTFSVEMMIADVEKLYRELLLN